MVPQATTTFILSVLQAAVWTDRHDLPTAWPDRRVATIRQPTIGQVRPEGGPGGCSTVGVSVVGWPTARVMRRQLHSAETRTHAMTAASLKLVINGAVRCRVGPHPQNAACQAVQDRRIALAGRAGRLRAWTSPV